MEYSPKKMQDLLDKNAFHLKKQYGQNFIVDENIINNIINKAELNKNIMVIEIGPGAGSLTYKLACACQNVLCYEIDTSLKNILNENLLGVDNVDIIFNDFLKSNVKDDLKKYQFEQLYVVANLPYYITTPIIMKIIEDKLPVDKIVVMVQKEVGNRFKAQPNSKDYNSLSIYLNYYYHVVKLMDISRNIFIPKPNVDSIIVSFTKRKDKVKVNDEVHFFELVHTAFTQKRKNLRNNLKKYDLNILETELNKMGLDLNVRAEALSIEQFAQLSNALVDRGMYDK